jgi:hypothetical protein
MDMIACPADSPSAQVQQLLKRALDENEVIASGRYEHVKPVAPFVPSIPVAPVLPVNAMEKMVEGHLDYAKVLGSHLIETEIIENEII